MTPPRAHPRAEAPGWPARVQGGLRAALGRTGPADAGALCPRGDGAAGPAGPHPAPSAGGRPAGQRGPRTWPRMSGPLSSGLALGHGGDPRQGPPAVGRGVTHVRGLLWAWRLQEAPRFALRPPGALTPLHKQALRAMPRAPRRPGRGSAWRFPVPLPTEERTPPLEGPWLTCAL